MYEMTQFGKITEDPDGNLRFENFTIDCGGDPHCSLILAIVHRLLASIRQEGCQAGLKRGAAICENWQGPLGGWIKQPYGVTAKKIEQAILKEMKDETK
jgi:hypothetical protein